MEKIALNIKLAPSVVAKLDHLARNQALSRQDLIDGILTELASTADAFTECQHIPLPPGVQDAVNTGIDLLPVGAETNLKKLVGKEVWSTLANGVKTSLGKNFKILVQHNEFPELRLGRKKSDNEQQYDRI